MTPVAATGDKSALVLLLLTCRVITVFSLLCQSRQLSAVIRAGRLHPMLLQATSIHAGLYRVVRAVTTQRDRFCMRSRHRTDLCHPPI